MKSLFQGLIVLSVILYVSFFCTPYIAHLIYSEETTRLLLYNGFGAAFPVSGLLVYGLFIGYGVASFGMLKFKNWGRQGYLIFIVLNILLTPIFGLGVTGILEATLGKIFYINGGAILAIAYFTKINDEFQTVT